MSNAPYLVLKARSGLRLGHGEIVDHMFFDGLEDAYDQGKLMGSFAEDCASRYGFTREMQDAFAIEVADPRANAPSGKESSKMKSPRLWLKHVKVKSPLIPMSSRARRISRKSHC